MISRYRRVLAPVSLVVLALWAGACGDDSKDTDTPSADESATAEKLIDINAMPRDQVMDGGTMRWPLDQYSAQWNYNHLDGATSATYDVMWAMMPIPFIADEKADVTPEPGLRVVVRRDELGQAGRDAEAQPEGEVDRRARRSTGRTTRRSGRRCAAENGFTISSSTGYERIGSVEQGADQFEVVISFDKPFGEWQSLFTPLYPKQAQDTPKGFNKAYVDKIPVTAGAFKLDKLDKSAKTLRVVRNPDWWGEPAKLEAIAYSGSELEAQVNAFANGEVDRVNIGADASLTKRAAGRFGRHRPRRRRAGLPAVHDQRHERVPEGRQVRRALALSINRETIAKSSLSRPGLAGGDDEQPLLRQHAGGLHRQLRRVRQVRSREGEGRCSTPPAGSSTASSARRAARR